MKAYKKTIGTGRKMDIHFNIFLIYLKEKNLLKLKEHIDECKRLLEEGGDWERKNKLKVYEGVYFLIIRDLKKASELFLDCVSTFSSPEIISYNELVYYTVLTCMIFLSR